MIPDSNFILLPSTYGDFIVPKHDACQPQALRETQRPHIHQEIDRILNILARTNCRTLIDVGANVGLISIPAAKFLAQRGGTVHSIEPQRMLFYCLCGNAALNGCENLRAYNFGCAEYTGEGYFSSELNYNSTRDFGTYKLEYNSLSFVDSVQLESLDNHFRYAGLLKIDVEGMEIPVLRGGNSLIKNSWPCIWIEYNIVGLGAICQELDPLGYKHKVIDSQNALFIPSNQIHLQSEL